MVWKVVKSAQPPVRYRPNSDRRPDIVWAERVLAPAATVGDEPPALALLRVNASKLVCVLRPTYL